jgi:hypothetical protein
VRSTKKAEVLPDDLYGELAVEPVRDGDSDLDGVEIWRMNYS